MLNYNIDKATMNLLIGILCMLIVSSVIGTLLQKKAVSVDARSTADNLMARIKAWWVMIFIFAITMFIGHIGSVVLFSVISFLALREFIQSAPATKGVDRDILIWVYLIILPFQYYLVGAKWYGLLSIFIPVYAFLFVPVRLAMADDHEHFFERTAKIQWALMVCVYFVSYAPALLILNIPNFQGRNVKLLLFLVIVVTVSDVFQYIFGKCLGRTKIAPNISPNKTVEGFIGGVTTAIFVGASLWWVTPFTPLQAAAISLVIALMGFFGGITMSAVKRERGIKDYGTLLPGHGGMLDRIDSLCFAAPVFFHLVRYYFT